MTRFATLAEVCAEQARRSLAEFVKQGWPQIEPAPLQWNWHIDAICDHLQGLFVVVPPGSMRPRPPQNLLINVPPGSTKSLVFSVFLTPWRWLTQPSWRAIYSSGSPGVVTRDSLKCRNLIRSEWYARQHAALKLSWKIAPDQDEKQHYANTAGGFRRGIGAGASVVGERADFLGVDDPNDPDEVHSKAHRDGINRWWDDAWHNRIADPSTSRRGLIMQRLHEEDLAGHVLEREAGDWAHLCIPMERDSDGPGDRPTWRGWTDPRRVDGELMFPDRFTPAFLASERKTLGSAGYAGQMQQRPAPASGNRFKREWWRFWSPTGERQARPKGCSEVPPLRFDPGVDKVDETIGSWDCAFKDGDQNDWVVGGTVKRQGARRLVVALFRRKAGLGATVAALRQQHDDWNPDEIIVEDKANGSAVVETLSGEIPAVIGVDPKGGKESRAAVLEPKVEAGNWYLPEGAEWLGDWVEEFAVFPKGKHDDQVDMASQAEARFLEDSEVANTRALLGIPIR